MISEIKSKGKKPNFFDPDLWEGCPRYWNTLEAKKIHETCSMNKMSKAANRLDLQLTLKALLLIMTMEDNL